LERYPVNLRYPRASRDSREKLLDLPIITPTGEHIPLSRVAQVRFTEGPPMIKTENARLNGWTFVDIRDRDLGSYLQDAQQRVAEQVELPPGYSISWAGQYEYLLRVQEKLRLLVPMTLIIIFILLYLTFNNMMSAAIVMLSLPFVVSRGVWYLWWLDLMSRSR
jgi:Putative silver efflux pump